jgi:hypothetical protein
MTQRPSPTEPQAARADQILGGSMVFVAVRCTLQYVVLPFILPLFGITDTFSAGLSIVIELVALGMILYNIRRLWSTSWRWRYLGLSVVMLTLIAILLYADLQVVLGSPG